MNDPSGGNDRPVTPEVRVSDAEREAVVARLDQACGEGCLTLDELSGRVEQAYRATVRPELDAVVADLPPKGATGQAASPPAAGGTRWWVTPIGGFRRRGRFRLPEHQVVVTLLGGMDVDLRGAELSGPTATITLVTAVGGAQVVVPAGVHVEVGGFSVVGGRDVRLDLGDRPAATAPVIRLRLFAVVGGVTVRSERRRDGRAPGAP